MNKLTKKVNFSQSVFANNNLVYLYWDANQFSVFSKTDPSTEFKPLTNTQWDFWTPFSNSWDPNLPIKDLSVEFLFKGRIPPFEKVEWNDLSES